MGFLSKLLGLPEVESESKRKARALEHRAKALAENAQRLEVLLDPEWLLMLKVVRIIRDFLIDKPDAYPEEVIPVVFEKVGIDLDLTDPNNQTRADAVRRYVRECQRDYDIWGPDDLAEGINNWHDGYEEDTESERRSEIIELGAKWAFDEDLECTEDAVFRRIHEIFCRAIEAVPAFAKINPTLIENTKDGLSFKCWFPHIETRIAYLREQHLEDLKEKGLL